MFCIILVLDKKVCPVPIDLYKSAIIRLGLYITFIFKQHGVGPQFRINILGVFFTCICIDVPRHTSFRVQGVRVRSNVTKESLP